MYYEIPGTPVRLAGSIHRVPAASVKMPDWIWDAYEWSEELVFEADPTDGLPHFFSADHSSLRKKLPEQVWRALIAVWPKTGPIAELDLFKPWGALLTLPLLVLPTAEGVEPLLTALATRDSKPIHYLETVAEFAALADTVPDAVYAELISKAIADLPRTARTLIEVYDAWRSERIEDIEAVLPRTILGEAPLIRSLAIDRRNMNWVPKIIKVLRSERRTLIAVGALHLPGRNGLIALLELAGYRPRRVVS